MNSILFALSVLYVAGYFVAAIIAAVRSMFEAPPSREELERANMRSLSWPTRDHEEWYRGALLSVLLVCGFLSYDTNLQAESRLSKMRDAMAVSYCAASAVDGWQSTRPGVAEMNPLLRGANGVSVPRMVTFKAATCAGVILAGRLRRGRRAVTVGTGALLGVQVLTDVHNGKVAR